ncbi:Crp/Fnr family transcriptional regulator [Nocardia sp. NPDC051030]|uniref:Crp/Fnr family transcriptional regulator n=1 Tax=Nocardia sp. NPDC051030 TaxID=3155162 RepID=UPI0034164FED
MARLSPQSRHDLLRLGVQTYHPPGKVLTRQGAQGTGVYLLRSKDTTVSACAKITAGDGKLFAIRVSGDVIGELGALEPSAPRSATTTLCTATIVHSIPGKMFLEFLDRHEAGWQTLCRTIADRLAWSDQRRLDFGGCPVHIRLARLLLEFVESYGALGTFEQNGTGAKIEAWEITVRLSYEELGDLIGAGVDAVGLAMSRMQKKDLVCLRNRHVVVLDIEGLREFGESA